MKTQKGNGENSQPEVDHSSGNGSSAAIGHGSPSIDTERSQSSMPAGNKARPSSLARRATGPRTPTGKERSKHNALRHGIFSKVALLKGESRSEFVSLLSGLREAIQPQGMLAEVQVE